MLQVLINLCTKQLLRKAPLSLSQGRKTKSEKQSETWQSKLEHSLKRVNRPTCAHFSRQRRAIDFCNLLSAPDCGRRRKGERGLSRR